MESTLNITAATLPTLKSQVEAASTIELATAAAQTIGHTLVATDPVAAKAELTQVLESWTEPTDEGTEDVVLPTALTEELVQEMKAKTFAPAGSSDYINRAALAGKTVTGYFLVSNTLQPLNYLRADNSKGASFAFFQEVGEGQFKITHVTSAEYDLIKRATRLSDKVIDNAKYAKHLPIGVLSCSISFANDERGTIKMA